MSWNRDVKPVYLDDGMKWANYINILIRKIDNGTSNIKTVLKEHYMFID